MSWAIDPDCENVNIFSTEFKTESGYDYLHIGDRRFSGSEPVKGTFETPVSLKFTSDRRRFFLI